MSARHDDPSSAPETGASADPTGSSGGGTVGSEGSRRRVDLEKRRTAREHRHERLDHFVEDAVEAELHTGRREPTVELARRHVLLRAVRVTAGTVVLLIGLVLLVAPGPGLLVVALGLGLLAQDVPFAARLLKMVRRRLPSDADGSIPRHMIVMMVAVAALAVAGSIGLTVWQMQG